MTQLYTRFTPPPPTPPAAYSKRLLMRCHTWRIIIYVSSGCNCSGSIILFIMIIVSRYKSRYFVSGILQYAYKSIVYTSACSVNMYYNHRPSPPGKLCKSSAGWDFCHYSIVLSVQIVIFQASSQVMFTVTLFSTCILNWGMHLFKIS
jgi:hypothetical protein